MNEENASKNPGDQGGNDQGQGLAPPNGNNVGKPGFGLGDITKLMGESGFCVWIVVDLLRDPGMQWWLKMLLWASVSLVLFDIAHTISVKIWPKKCQIFPIYSILVLALLIAAFRPIPVPPAPHFTVSIRTADSPTSLSLDKDFLYVFKVPGNVIWKDVRGRLLIPMASGRSNAALRFSLFNDTIPFADSPLVVVSMPTNLPYAQSRLLATEPVWYDILVSKGTEDLRLVGVQLPSLLLHMGRPLPDLIFPNLENWVGKPIKMSIVTQARDIPQSGTAFIALFTTNVSQITLTTNTDNRFF